MWEIYLQFKYDNHPMEVTFALQSIEKEQRIHLPAASFLMIAPLVLKKFSELDISKFDKIIILTSGKSDKKNDNTVYLNDLKEYFIRRVYCEIPLWHFIKNNPKVKLFVTNFPFNPKTDLEFEKNLPTIHSMIELIRKSSGNAKTLLDKFGYSNAEVLKMISNPPSKKNPDGSTSMIDDGHPLIRIKNGKRETAYQPEYYKNKIYFVGPSHQFGYCAPYDKTIESYLQKMLNEHHLPYRVENEGQCFSFRQQGIFYNLNKLNLMPNDIVFVHTSHILPKNIPFVDLRKVFDSYDYRDIFVEKTHVNEIGYKIIAEKFFKHLTENNFFQGVEFNYPPPPLPPHRYGIPKESFSQSVSVAERLFDMKEVTAYQERLRKRRLKVGILGLNANPFHLGHQYLVEYAAARVNKLFVMVLSEDKSFFKFEDRFRLVQEGTKQFPNVEVLPTEKFVSSMQTFSGYFNREKLQDVYVDLTDNAEMWASVACTALGVTVRFDGTEPSDNLTNQFHRDLAAVLPKYGIEHVEIPRKEIDGKPISAKTVRAALEVGDFDKIKKLVPKTTYDFLVENYSKAKIKKSTEEKFSLDISTLKITKN